MLLRYFAHYAGASSWVYLMRVAVVILVSAVLLAVNASGSDAQGLRGAYVTAWTHGFFSSQEADATLAAAEDAGINALFIQVRKNADAYYDSSLEPRGGDLAPGFDPLAYLVDKARARGIQIHAWINVYRVWTADDPPEDASHILNAFPEWINRNHSGKTRATEGIYLDPGVLDAHEHIISVVADIAARYNVDGIHLDYIRYPGNDWGYAPAALSRYYAETGRNTKPKPEDPAWLEWRREQVTSLVSRISKRVRSLKPGMPISTATIAWDDCPRSFSESSPYRRVCQDWEAWLEEGLIDFNVPMNYRQERIPKHADQFRKWLEAFKTWGHGLPVYVGIDIHHNQPEHILRQMEAARKRGIDGFVLFSFNQIPQRQVLVGALGSVSWLMSPADTPADTQAVTPPSDTEALIAKATRSMAANQLGMARVYLKKAAAASPERADIFFMLGECYRAERNASKAVEMYQKVLQLDPAHKLAGQRLESLKSVNKT